MGRSAKTAAPILLNVVKEEKPLKYVLNAGGRLLQLLQIIKWLFRNSRNFLRISS
jgi:hypothetical protein